jgi:hypothetical protein
VAELPSPPPDRPRLYLRAGHVAQLPARFKDPVLRPVVARLEVMARTSAQRRVEWEALRYLMAPDAARGRRKVRAVTRSFVFLNLRNQLVPRPL